MNFLLYMMGRFAGRSGGGAALPVLRQEPRRLLMSGAAQSAAQGNWDQAVTAYQKLIDAGGSVIDTLIGAHLKWKGGRLAEAREGFVEGLEWLLARGFAPCGEVAAAEELLGQAERFMREGRFSRALEQARRARSVVDVMMAAEAGVLLCNEAATAGPALFGLTSMAALSDMTLKLVARIHLARQLALSLQEKHLRDDLAAWATSDKSAGTLMEAEFGRLADGTVQMPGHAEGHFRKGLVARVLGRSSEAAAAFANVLRIHPHHVESATRLVVEQPGAGAVGMGSLKRAFDVPAETLGLFKKLADLAHCPAAVDETADRLCGAMAGEKERLTARGNLAFALAEVSAEDAAWSAWREVAPL